MTITASDASATGIEIDQIHSVDFPGAFVADATVSQVSPSPFESLLARQIGTFDGANSEIHDPTTASVDHKIESHDANRTNSHELVLTSLSTNGATELSLFFNPIVVTQSLSFKASYAQEVTSNRDSTQIEADGRTSNSTATPENSTSLSGSRNEPTTAETASDQFAEILQETDGEQEINEAGPKDAGLNLSVMSDSIGKLSFPIIENVISNSSVMETGRSSAPTGNSLQPTSLAASVDRGNLAIISSNKVSGVDDGTDVGNLEIAKGSRAVVSVTASQTPKRSSHSDEDSTTASPVLLSQAGSVNSHNVDSEAPLSNDLAESIAEQIEADVNNGATSIRIRLDEPGLGSVDLHLSILNGLVSIRIVTQNPTTRQIIENQLTNLQQSLNDRGIQATECQVTCDSNGGQSSLEDSRPEADKPARDILSRSPRTTVRPVQTSSTVVRSNCQLSVVV